MSPATLRGAAPAAAAFAVLTAALALPCYWHMFSFFAPYDDEGTMLMTLRGLVEGGAPYRDLYSQYGPFWLETFGAFFAITGRPITHDSGRLIVVAMCLVGSLLTGVATHRLAGSLLLGLGAQLLAYRALLAQGAEPMHPSGSIVVLFSVALAVGALVWPARPRLALGLLWAIAAALALIKINVGGFLAVALLFALGVTHERLPRPALVRAAACAMLVALPVVLIAPDLENDSNERLAWLLGVGALAVALAAGLAPALRTTDVRRPLALAAAGMLAVAVPVLGALLVLGSSPRDVVEGILIAPTRQRTALVGPFDALPDSTKLVALAAAVAVTAVVAVRRSPVLRAKLLPLGAAGRLAAGVVIWWSILQPYPTAGRVLTPLAVPILLAWVAALPSVRDARLPPGRAGFLRALLPAAAVCEALQVYPVAGSQVAFSLLLFVPLAAICIADGVAELRAWAATRPGTVRRALPATATVVAGVAVAAFALDFARDEVRGARDAYRGGVPMPFPEASRLRLPEGQVSEFARLVGAIQQRCDAMVTMPGYGSLYFWSHVPPPTRFNTTHWWSLLTPRQEREMIARVRTAKRPCGILNLSAVDAWNGPAPIPDGRPLADYIERDMRPVEVVGPYEIRMPHG